MTSDGIDIVRKRAKAMREVMRRLRKDRDAERTDGAEPKPDAADTHDDFDPDPSGN